MPLYEYECDRCEHRFERIQKFSDPPVETCPKCGGSVRKLVSSPAFQFKGTGWYVTDYAKKDVSAGKGDKSEGAEKGADSSASTAKSEGKTESKSESKSESTSPAKTESTKSS